MGTKEIQCREVGFTKKNSVNLAHLGSTPSIGKAPRANPWCLTQEGQRWCLGSFQHHLHLLSQLTVFPSPCTQMVATYRSIELASAIHGHEESTSNTKYAHHSSFHRGDFQQTYIGDMRNQGDKVLCPEGVCGVSPVLTQRFPFLVWCGSPCPSTAVGGHRSPASCPTCCPMLHAGTSLLLAKYLFLHCPQASSCVAEVKISQSVLGGE